MTTYRTTHELRDQYFCAALQGLLTRNNYNTGVIGVNNYERLLVNDAWIIADEALKQRNQKAEG